MVIITIFNIKSTAKALEVDRNVADNKVCFGFFFAVCSYRPE